MHSVDHDIATAFVTKSMFLKRPPTNLVVLCLFETYFDDLLGHSHFQHKYVELLFTGMYAATES